MGYGLLGLVILILFFALILQNLAVGGIGGLLLLVLLIALLTGRV